MANVCVTFNAERDTDTYRVVMHLRKIASERGITLPKRFQVGGKYGSYSYVKCNPKLRDLVEESIKAKGFEII